MIIFRNVKNKRLYNLFLVSPRGYTGSWFESRDYITGETRKLNHSSWKREDFIEVAAR